MSAKSPGIDDEDLPRVLKLLERVGYEAKPPEFTQTLEKFKAHPEALKALRKGVTRQGRGEDRGSYCENASPGYNDWWKKQNLLDKLDLEDDKAFLQNIAVEDLPRKAAKEESATLGALKAQMREMTERIEALEKRALRGPVVKPGLPPGPG